MYTFSPYFLPDFLITIIILSQEEKKPPLKIIPES